MKMNGVNEPESLAKIAKEVGLSTATVSRVLNNSPRVRPETRQRILQAVNRNRGFFRGRTGVTTIGLSLTDFHAHRLNEIYTQDLLAGILQAGKELAFALRPVDLVAERRPRESFPQLVARLGMDGVITSSPPDSFFPAIESIADAGFPLCVIGAKVDHPQVNWIDPENLESSRKAMNYLINLGHRRIAIVNPATMEDHRERREGYLRALSEAGINADPKLQIERQHDVSVDGGASATMELLSQQDPPTAIYFAHNEFALGGVQACRKMGVRIPEDVSIVTFGDSYITELMTPKLTMIRQPVFEMGRLAGQCVAEQAKHREGEILRRVVVPDFVISESTGPAKKN